MSVAIRQSSFQNNGGSAWSSGTLATTLTETVLANSIMAIMFYATTAVTVSSISGLGVGTWTQGVNSVTGGLMTTYYGLVNGTPGGIVTPTLSSAPSVYGQYAVVELTGCNPTSPIDTSNTTQMASNATAVYPVLTLANAGEVILAQAALLAAESSNTPGSFTDFYSPAGVFQTASYAVLASTSYTNESYGLSSAAGWYSQATAFAITSTPTGIAGYPFIAKQAVKRGSLY